MQGQGFARHLVFIISALLVAMFMVSACGGGGSGDGDTTVSLSGIVIDPLAGVDPVPVGDVLIGAYRFDNSTLINSTTSAAGVGTGTFTLTGLPKDVELYVKRGKTGYINVNTRTVILSADETDLEIIILPDDDELIIEIANRLYNQNESSWNNTLQEAGYIIMDAEDNTIDGDELEGLTVTGQHVSTASSLGIMYYSNLPDGSGTYIVSGPTGARAETNDLPMLGAAVSVGADLGGYALTGNLSGGTLEESAINAPIIPGEITYFVWYEQ